MGGYCGYEARCDMVRKGVGWMQNKAGFVVYL